MFCSGCGTVCLPNAKFCHHCGKELPGIQGSPHTPSNTDSGHQNKAANSEGTNVSFDSFRARKQAERSKFFKCSGKSKAKKPKIEEKESDVKINVGIMLMKDGKLSIKRGATLPLTVAPSITARGLLTNAVEKHARFNNNLVDQRKSYSLLYSNYKEVLIIPGTQQLFTLKKYKEEIDKPYSRITFFLCSSSEYMDSVFCDYGPDSTDDELPVDDPLTMASKYNVIPIDLNVAGSGASSSAQEKVDVLTIDIVPPRNPQPIQCPLCLESFPAAEIETHADNCSTWLLDEDIDSSTDLLSSSNEQPSEMINPTLDDTKKQLGQRINEIAQTQMGEAEPKRVTVRRKFLWLDFKDARRRKITPKDRIKVVFSGEPAIDEGGPKRELFSELLSVIQRKFFQDGRPVCSTIALSSGEFRLCGEIMGMSILQGGPAPNFMDATIVSFITDKPLLPCQNKVASYKLLGEELVNVDSDDEVRNILTKDVNLDILHEIGYSGIPQRETTWSAKAIIQSLCVKDQLGQYLPQLLEIQSGLATCGLLDDIKKNADLWSMILESGNTFKLSADELLDQIEAEFSDSQLMKMAEIDTYKFFCDTIETIAAGAIEGLVIGDVLQWLTGCAETPPLGFPKQLGIKFVHGCQEGCRCRPTVSTCDTCIKMPIHVSNAEDMKELLFSAIKDSYGFGNI